MALKILFGAPPAAPASLSSRAPQLAPCANVSRSDSRSFARGSAGMASHTSAIRLVRRAVHLDDGMERGADARSARDCRLQRGIEQEGAVVIDADQHRLMALVQSGNMGRAPGAMRRHFGVQRQCQRRQLVGTGAQHIVGHRAIGEQRVEETSAARHRRGSRARASLTRSAALLASSVSAERMAVIMVMGGCPRGKARLIKPADIITSMRGRIIAMRVSPAVAGKVACRARMAQCNMTGPRLRSRRHQNQAVATQRSSGQAPSMAAPAATSDDRRGEGQGTRLSSSFRIRAAGQRWDRRQSQNQRGRGQAGHHQEGAARPRRRRYIKEACADPTAASCSGTRRRDRAKPSNEVARHGDDADQHQGSVQAKPAFRLAPLPSRRPARAAPPASIRAMQAIWGERAAGTAPDTCCGWPRRAKRAGATRASTGARCHAAVRKPRRIERPVRRMLSLSVMAIFKACFCQGLCQDQR